MGEDKSVGAVALKLPTFWAAQPHVWYAQAEAQFAVRKITDDTTKYYYVIAALDQQTAGRLLDILAKPPVSNSYVTLKSRLLKTFGLGHQERATKLLHMSGLGDRKPSELMDEMLSLLDGHESCFLFQALYLEQLPEDMRLQLAEDNFEDPRSLGARADVLWQAKLMSKTDIDKVTADATVTTRPSTRQYTPAENGMCYYHHRFGSRAWQCKPPCSFKATLNANAGNRKSAR